MAKQFPVEIWSLVFSQLAPCHFQAQEWRHAAQTCRLFSQGFAFLRRECRERVRCWTSPQNNEVACRTLSGAVPRNHNQLRDLLRWHEGRAVFVHFVEDSEWLVFYDPIQRTIEKYVECPLDFPCAIAVKCGYIVLGSTWEEIAVFEMGERPRLVYCDFCHLPQGVDGNDAMHLQVINALDIFTDSSGTPMLLVAANGGTVRLYSLPDMVLQQRFEYDTWPNTVRVQRTIAPHWLLTGGDSGQFSLLSLLDGTLQAVDVDGATSLPNDTSVFCVAWNARSTLCAIHRTSSIDLFRTRLLDGDPTMSLLHTFHLPSSCPPPDAAAAAAASGPPSPEAGMYGSVCFSDYPEMLVMSIGSAFGIADLSCLSVCDDATQHPPAPWATCWRFIEESSMNAGGQGLCGLVVDPEARFVITATQSAVHHYSVRLGCSATTP